MNVKQRLNVIVKGMLIVALSVSTLTLSSCSKDEEDNSLLAQLLGKWMHEYSNDNYEYKEIYEIKANGWFSATFSHREKGETEWRTEMPDNMLYELSGNLLTVWDPNDYIDFQGIEAGPQFIYKTYMTVVSVEGDKAKIELTFDNYKAMNANDIQALEYMLANPNELRLSEDQKKRLTEDLKNLKNEDQLKKDYDQLDFKQMELTRIN